MSTATFSPMPQSPAVAHSRDGSDPFDAMLAQLLTCCWVVLVEPNGNIHRRISRPFNDTPSDRALMAKVIRVVRAQQRECDGELNVGVERVYRAE
ncbi:hypothetical protein NHH03_06905 [Stieleria sp. TO1_6]|uniref:hypothetical protein n=1 Tax=Stieleria tagensis TaxID=2956795 RepID=UPI00209B48D9|nr:hypothetical protein [Stieleria tagensis]MCO8121460.1 hypothetical protein [Stieleria tagensis]